MAAETVPYGRKTQKPPPSPKFTSLDDCRLGCDGDSVSITAATQPSIEDVILGAIPGLPKVISQSRSGLRGRRRFHEVLVSWRKKGKLDPFVLVVEGSIPNEKIKKEGYWAALGPIRRPVSRSPPTNGSTAWPPKRWR